MKKFLFGSACLVALLAGGAANAADMPLKAAPMAPLPPAYSWAGFYVGGNFGYSWGDWDVRSNYPLLVSGQATFTTPVNTLLGPGFESNQCPGGSLSQFCSARPNVQGPF